MTPSPDAQAARWRELARELRIDFEDGNPASHALHQEAADALDALAKVVERCEEVDSVMNHGPINREYYEVAARNAERRAILALLVAAGQRQE